MRLLFVGSNPGGGGTESHFIALARALAEAGHEISAAVRPEDFIHRGLAQDPRIQLYPLEFRTRRDVRAMRHLSRLARTLKPDWIVGAFKAEYWPLSIVAKSAGVRLVLFSHLDQRIRPVMLSPFTRLVRTVIVPSEYLRRRSIERGLPPARVAVLPNPIDVDGLKPDPALRARVRASLGVDENDLVFGFVGRFEPQKGVETLGRALNEAMSVRPRLHALWVGHGPLEPFLRDVAKAGAASTRHHWMPWLDDVRPAYAAMDMLALPSIGSETFGRVLVEAQAYGLPVLGARNGGIPEAMIENQTGTLVAPGDVSAWAAAIGELSDNDVLRRRYGAAGRLFAQDFSGERIVEGFIQILRSFDPNADTPNLSERRSAPATLARRVGVD